MPSINGVSVCLSASSGIVSSPTMKFDARPTNLYSTDIIQAWHLTLFEHIAWMDDNIDALFLEAVGDQWRYAHS